MFVRGYVVRAVLILFLLGVNCTHAYQSNIEENTDKISIAVSNYYEKLVTEKSPKSAELQLFVNMLPKGADLHHHYSGAIYAETYLDWVKMKNYCIYRDDNVEVKAQKFHIETKPEALTEVDRKICISADDTTKDNAFYRELLMHWSNIDYANHSHEQPAPDRQFFDTFAFFSPVSKALYHDGLQSIKNRAISENVQYIETMIARAPDFECPEFEKKLTHVDCPDLKRQLNGLTAKSTNLEIEEAFTNFSNFMDKDLAFKEKVSRYVKMLNEAAENIDGPSFILRFQAFVLRTQEPDKVFSTIYSSFAAAKNSKFVVGVNIVGPENDVVAMRDYSLHMKMFRFFKLRFPQVKLALHSGELVMGMVPPEGLKSHINEAIRIAGADRIGHGVDIAHEEDAYKLLQIMKEKKIAVEINLTSNAFILGVENEKHPIELYRKYNIPFVISSDDAGVSRGSLSNEYLLYTSRYKPSYAELKKVVYNSIWYSFLTDAEKKIEIQELDKRFSIFEQQIVDILHEHDASNVH